ncbi:hypothetical protein, variant [Aphanomyces invadans]|uniref:Uncharacterized protein n=1 Tax=Aphanomyces invadans TaxID=157072 RepID=A0A024U5T2_9STRA|nr:hypothetical protein, variant [Aphanomyces invadans]ETW01629.1 hypothetical protein, variant [Aphanomyces invadans]|eukprot:XP_008869477.1 hypothetical protein, variant [Aphanomyces invadans]
MKRRKMNHDREARRDNRRKSTSIVVEVDAEESVHVIEMEGKSPAKLLSSVDPVLPRILRTTEKDKKPHDVWSHTRMIVLFACAAEAITTCFTPEWVHEPTGINVSATLLNVLGPFMEGVAQHLQETTAHPEWKRACYYFRSVFLGVFTSYCYMVDHAGDLVGKNPFIGPLYIISSLCYACVAFRMGQTFMRLFLANIFQPDKRLPSSIVGWGLTAFILVVLVVAIAGPPGFVRDPNDAQFLGPIAVNDGLELILGMAMSITATWLASFVSVGNYDGSIDWGTWRCNLASVILTVLAYGVHYILPGVAHNVAVKKFVSSFCGSLSGFSATIAATMVRPVILFVLLFEHCWLA